MSKATLSLVLLFALHASTVQAQPPGGVFTRPAAGAAIGYVEVNLGLQATSSAFEITTRPLTFVEPSTVDSSYSVQGAREFDFGGGVRVAPRLTVGGSFSRFEKAGSVTVDAKVPHPFFFNQPRTVTGTASDLARRETGLHGKIAVVTSMGGGWEIAVSGGPSFLTVEQDLVEDITIDQTYPYDTARFASAISTRHSTSGLGFNVGADITKLFTPHFGVGAAVTMTRAKLHFDTFSDPTRTFDVGGARVGGGLRFRF
jgi:hypothetical protein